eukprot:gene15249-biopygen5182
MIKRVRGNRACDRRLMRNRSQSQGASPEIDGGTWVNWGTTFLHGPPFTARCSRPAIVYVELAACISNCWNWVHKRRRPHFGDTISYRGGLYGAAGTPAIDFALIAFPRETEVWLEETGTECEDF